MKILLLASQHGNEYSGEKLYRHIEHHHPELLEHVTFMIGNPKARKQRVRYIESDMNRSYNGHKDTYEQRRAQKILSHIQQEQYDLVLDMHTTSVEQPSCVIVSSISKDNESFLHATSINKIVVIDKSISKHALNGVMANAVSIELNQEIQRQTLEELCDDIARYSAGIPSDIQKSVFEVKDLLLKTELNVRQVDTLRNFEYSDFGFYPILVGENSYKKQTHYLGFKAYKRYEFKV